MEIQGALFLAAALFALLQFGLLPRMKNAWSRLPLDKQLKRFGVLAILKKVRDYRLIAALCLLAFAVVLASELESLSKMQPPTRSDGTYTEPIENLG